MATLSAAKTDRAILVTGVTHEEMAHLVANKKIGDMERARLHQILSVDGDDWFVPKSKTLGGVEHLRRPSLLN